ncbi:FASCICLIN-like arabinogalactan 2 [Actinidia rufa]|uniref:FASCICLIN-like arabinogalactan 2 n=1 Tax=Actinidia rufa TaxID=165716 RepID=A0A7J0G3J1_9ERIC|nr:FASCICLIN-like arabinogalactan 2 [Actinidia rufa]
MQLSPALTLSLLLSLLSLLSLQCPQHHPHPLRTPGLLHLQPLPDPDPPRRRDQPPGNNHRVRRRQRRHVHSPCKAPSALHPPQRPLTPRLRRLLRRQEAPPDPQRLYPHCHPLPGHRRGLWYLSGYVNITNQKGGRVSFAAIDHAGDLSATFVKSVFELPYNISVIQISHILTSAEAEAPNPSPTLNLTTLISKQGCTSFSDLLISSGALDTFNENLDGGLTVFLPKRRRFDCVHAQTLKSSNGLMNTLATDGAEKFDFTVQNDGDNVMLKTKVVTATVTATVVDKEPLIAYKIDKVLLPAELFKPAKAAPAPKAEKAGAEADAPGPSASDDEAADTTNDNGAGRFNGGPLVTAALVLCLGVFGLI